MHTKRRRRRFDKCGNRGCGNHSSRCGVLENTDDADSAEDLDHGSHADVREDSRQNFVAGYQASDADGGIEQKNAKEQRSEEANDGKQCHTDVVRDADQGKSSIGNTGNLCPEIGQKIGKGHSLVVKKQGVCGKIPDCVRQKQKSEGSENGKCV